MNERLVAFLYILMRDEVTYGAVEKVLRDADKLGPHNPPEFSNRHLEGFARECAERLVRR